MNRSKKLFVLWQISIFLTVAISIRLIFGETSQPNWAISTAYASLLAIPLFLARKQWHLIIPLAYAAALWAGAVYLRLNDPNQVKSFGDSGYMSSFPWFYLSLGLVACACEFVHRYRNGKPMGWGNFWFTYYAFSVAAWSVVQVGLEHIGLAGSWAQWVSNGLFAVMASYIGYSEIKGYEGTPSAAEAETEYKKAA